MTECERQLSGLCGRCRQEEAEVRIDHETKWDFLLVSCWALMGMRNAQDRHLPIAESLRGLNKQ